MKRWIKLINFLPILLIKLYRYILSPFWGSNCRYFPTCSAYALGCLTKYNLFYGVYLIGKRIVGCRPGGGCGYDPVP